MAQAYSLLILPFKLTHDSYPCLPMSLGTFTQCSILIFLPLCLAGDCSALPLSRTLVCLSQLYVLSAQLLDSWHIIIKLVFTMTNINSVEEHFPTIFQLQVFCNSIISNKENSKSFSCPLFPKSDCCPKSLEQPKTNRSQYDLSLRVFSLYFRTSRGYANAVCILKLHFQRIRPVYLLYCSFQSEVMAMRMAVYF